MDVNSIAPIYIKSQCQGSPVASSQATQPKDEQNTTSQFIHLIVRLWHRVVYLICTQEAGV